MCVIINFSVSNMSFWVEKKQSNFFIVSEYIKIEKNFSILVKVSTSFYYHRSRIVFYLFFSWIKIYLKFTIKISCLSKSQDTFRYSLRVLKLYNSHVIHTDFQYLQWTYITDRSSSRPRNIIMDRIFDGCVVNSRFFIATRAYTIRIRFETLCLAAIYFNFMTWHWYLLLIASFIYDCFRTSYVVLE